MGFLAVNLPLSYFHLIKLLPLAPSPSSRLLGLPARRRRAGSPRLGGLPQGLVPHERGMPKNKFFNSINPLLGSKKLRAPCFAYHHLGV